MKFNKEEVILCKQVAEKHKKEIKYGDWYLTITTNPLNKKDKEESVNLNIEKRTINPIEEMKKDRVFYNEYIPLWTISDCLEFLRDKGYSLETHEEGHFKRDIIYVEFHKYIEKMDIGHFHGKGKTDPEAFLRVVLAVLEEK
jgi:phage-related protein